MLFSSTVSTCVNFVVPGVFLLLGWGHIEFAARRLRKLVAADDESSRMLNPSHYHTTQQIDGASRCVVQIISAFVKESVVLISLLTMFCAIAIPLVLCFVLPDEVMYGILSLVALIVGAALACFSLFLMYRTSGSSLTLCSLAATTTTANTEESIQMVFSEMLSNAVGPALVAVSVGMLAAVASFQFGVAQYPLLSVEDVSRNAGIVAAASLGMALVSALLSLQGGMISKGIDINFDQQEIANYQQRQSDSILQCVGMSIGEMVQIATTLFPSFSECLTIFCLICTQETSNWKAHAVISDVDTVTFTLAPMWAFAASQVVTYLLCIIARAVPVDSSSGVLRRVRSIVMLSLACSIAVIWGLSYGFLPFPIYENSDGLVGLFRGRLDPTLLLSIMAMGGVAVIFVVEMCEFFVTAQFFVVRHVARSCTIGSPAATLSAMATSNMALITASVTCVAVFYAAYTFSGFIGIGMLCIGATIPLFSVLTVSHFPPYAKSIKWITETNALNPEVIAVAEDLTDRTAVVSAMTSAYISVASFFIAIGTLCAFAIFMYEEELVFFSTHVVAFSVLGCALTNFFSSAYLFGISESGQCVAPLVAAITTRATTRLRTPTPSTLQQSDVVEFTKVARAMRVYTVLPVFVALLLPALIGFVFGSEAIIGTLLGVTVTSFSATFAATAFGSTTESLKQWVVRGGLADVAQYQKHFEAAVTTATVGVSYRSANGPALIGLIKLMGAVCLVLAPALKEVSNKSAPLG